MTIVDQEYVTFALMTALATGTGKPVGDHQAPVNASGIAVDAPYSVVFALPGGRRWGPGWSNPDADVELMYQITSVGLTRRQAQWMSDKVRRIMIERSPTGGFLTSIVSPSGTKIIDRGADTSAGVIREGSLFSVPETYTVVLTPSI